MIPDPHIKKGPAEYLVQIEATAVGILFLTKHQSTSGVYRLSHRYAATRGNVLTVDIDRPVAIRIVPRESDRVQLPVKQIKAISQCRANVFAIDEKTQLILHAVVYKKIVVPTWIVGSIGKQPGCFHSCLRRTKNRLNG